jgi:hypothetical protein
MISPKVIKKWDAFTPHFLIAVALAYFILSDKAMG